MRSYQIVQHTWEGNEMIPKYDESHAKFYSPYEIVVKLNEVITALNNLERQAFWLTDNDRLTMNRPDTPKPEGQMTGGVPQVFPCERPTKGE
jgi:hypothetical protein